LVVVEPGSLLVLMLTVLDPAPLMLKKVRYVSVWFRHPYRY
jgi:hypothetical protein